MICIFHASCFCCVEQLRVMHFIQAWEVSPIVTHKLKKYLGLEICVIKEKFNFLNMNQNRFMKEGLDI